MNDKVAGQAAPGLEAASAASAAAALPRGALGAWWAQGTRSAFFQPPRWQGLVLTPAVLALLWLLPMAVSMGFERLGIDGPASFYWPTLLASGWLSLVVWWLVCAWLTQDQAADAAAPLGPLPLLAMVYAQALLLQLVLGLALVPLVRSGGFAEGHELLSLSRLLWLAGLLWIFAAQGVLLWRASAAPRAKWVKAMALVIALSLLQQFYMPLRHWYPDRPEFSASEKAPAFRLTQEVIEAQDQVLQRDLAALAPAHGGRINVFALTYAPDAEEDVFMRESALVADVMQQRFGATGRTLQLVSRRDPAPSMAWATPLNLQRAIQRMAVLMDREQDVLFIHLTSHGARNGKLASSLWPLEVEGLTPQQLKAWLDQAGIRQRIISVSACYSGSWIEPLAAEHTLVMTSSDAEHTSYGCGRHSELTYFGRALYGEQLRQTLSFEQAHAAARTVIDQREKEAKKSDGYSNPQIAMGSGIRGTLARLTAQLAGR